VYVQYKQRMAKPARPSGYQLEQAMSVLLSARTRMLEDPELSTDDVMIAAILESDPETCDAFELLHKVARAALHAKDMAAAAKQRAAEIAGRQKRFEHREETLRGILFAAMQAMGNISINQPDFDASIAAGGMSVFITNEAKIPEEYIKTVRTPMKKEIADAMRHGIVIEGAEWGNSMPSLRLRRS
jgi:hypothetical protein